MRWRRHHLLTWCLFRPARAKAADGSEGLEGRDPLLGVGATQQGRIK